MKINYKRELKDKDKRIDALEGLIKELWETSNYHRDWTPSPPVSVSSIASVPKDNTSNVPSIPFVPYEGRIDFIEFNPQNALWPWS